MGVLALAAVVLVTITELVQGPTVSAIVNESAAGDRGRYIATYQLTFSVVDVIAPALLTWALAQGPLATWLPLVGVAMLDVLGLLALVNRMPALRRRIGEQRTATDTRTIEADAL